MDTQCVTYVAVVAGTCKDRCYSGSGQGGCYCDSACTLYNDCCSDFDSLCLHPPPGIPSGEGEGLDIVNGTPFA